MRDMCHDLCVVIQVSVPFMRHFDTQPYANRVAHEIYRFSASCLRILMGFMNCTVSLCDSSLIPFYYPVLIVDPMGRILLRRQSFRNNLEILWHRNCICLYHDLSLVFCTAYCIWSVIASFLHLNLLSDFQRSLLPRSAEQRPIRLRLEIEIEWCN